MNSHSSLLFQNINILKTNYMTGSVPKNEEEFRKKLTPKQYAVMRQKSTEAPFSGKAIRPDRDGTYKCAACGHPLFRSEAKFDSGTGWPSFDEALPGAVEYLDDKSHGIKRTEIICAACRSHLGHVFDDGPTKTGKRYCLNSVCLAGQNDSINDKINL
jgi:peptide-methionine (R)-S-oxide reductase